MSKIEQGEPERGNLFSIDGLASGLDTSSIIQQLLSLERRPITLIQGQVERAQNKQAAYLDLSARLLAMQISSRRLADPDFFRGVNVESSNPDLLTASAGSGTPPGSYAFRVLSTARASQYTSNGFATNDALVGAGSLTLELGGHVDVDTDLDALNGGQGVQRGSIRITDASGASTLVDLSTAIDVDDVLGAIGSAGGISVSARISDSGRGILLEDTSGGTGNLTVEDLGEGQTAFDLGILGIATGTTLAGADVHRITAATSLATLRDGLGIRTGAGDDLSITRRDGTVDTLDLDGVTTVQGLIDALATLDPDLALSVNAAGDGLDLTDNGPGTGALTVTSGVFSSAAEDLGLTGSGAGGTITGSASLAGLDDRLLSNLHGGSGIAAGSIDITNRAGTVTTVDLSSARTVRDVIRAIDASGAGVTASMNRVGNGLRLVDSSGGTGDLSVAEVGGGTTAAELGLLGSVAGPELAGTDLDPRYVDENTRLATLNGGRGVAGGKIRLTDSNGVSFTVDLGQEKTIADVIRDIEGAGATSDITVSINAEGNGLVISSLTGAGVLRIEEVGGGTTARDLGILGVSDATNPGVIDGSFERTITIDADDTLQDVREAISELGLGIGASILNDGSASAPFRLSIVSGNTGRAARLQVDVSGTTALGFQQTATARDGVLLYGEDGDGSSSLMIRSATNSYENVVEGLTVTARGVSTTPIQVTVNEDREAVADEVAGLVAALNEVFEMIGDLTDFNLETEQRGILLGDSTVRNVQRNIIRAMTRPLGDGIENRFGLLSEVGIRYRSGRFQLDRAQFDSALAEDPTAVERLFGASRTLVGTTPLDEFEDGSGVRTKVGEDDIRFELRDGTQIELNLDTAVTVADVLAAIETAGAGMLTAELSTDGRSIVLHDLTTGTNTFRALTINSSGTANDLGISRSADTEGGGVLTGSPIDLDRDPGIAARFSDAISALTDSDDGVLQTRSDGLDDLIETLQDRIERIEERLVSREEILRRQFAQLEQIMAQSQATMDRLNAQLGGLRR